MLSVCFALFFLMKAGPALSSCTHTGLCEVKWLSRLPRHLDCFLALVFCFLRWAFVITILAAEHLILGESFLVMKISWHFYRKIKIAEFCQRKGTLHLEGGGNDRIVYYLQLLHSTWSVLIYSLKELLLQFEMLWYLTVSCLPLGSWQCQALLPQVCFKLVVSFQHFSAAVLSSPWSAQLLVQPCGEPHWGTELVKLIQEKGELLSFHPDWFPDRILWAAAQVLIYGGTSKKGWCSTGGWQCLADASAGWAAAQWCFCFVYSSVFRTKVYEMHRR